MKTLSERVNECINEAKEPSVEDILDKSTKILDATDEKDKHDVVKMMQDKVDNNKLKGNYLIAAKQYLKKYSKYLK